MEDNQKSKQSDFSIRGFSVLFKRGETWNITAGERPGPLGYHFKWYDLWRIW